MAELLTNSYMRTPLFLVEAPRAEADSGHNWTCIDHLTCLVAQSYRPHAPAEDSD